MINNINPIYLEEDLKSFGRKLAAIGLITGGSFFGGRAVGYNEGLRDGKNDPQAQEISARRIKEELHGAGKKIKKKLLRNNKSDNS